MKLGEIDLNLKPVKHSMFLCKPDRTVIAPLKETYNAKYLLKLGEVNELNFTIPTMIERNHKLVPNPLVKKIKDRFVVKFIHNGATDYLVFLDKNKSYSNNGEEISYRLYSESFLLADKHIRDYSATAKMLSTMLSEILEPTIWRVGYVDSYFDSMFRSHEITSQTILQAVFDLAKKFNAVAVWDTVNFTINFYNPAVIGTNKGLRFKEGKYLESFNVTTNSEEIVTRLKVYGKDNLTIRSLTPTGANYLEDFSWFTYPFERDSNGNVLQSSDYMSDSLCIALDDYNKKLENAQGAFKTYTEQLAIKQDERQQREQKLSVATAELKIIQDKLDVLNAVGNSGTPEHTQAINDKQVKESEIANHNSLIAQSKADIATLDSNWSAMRATLVIEANLSPDNLIELNKYIIEKEHVNDTIIDVEDLLKEGMEAFNQARTPKVSLNMSIINFLSVIEAQNDWKKLYLGDIVTTESRRLDVEIQAKIIEIEYDFENDGINLTIANEQDIKDDDSKWLDQLYNAGQTSTQVNMNKFKWDMIEETGGVVSEILNSVWDATRRGIVAGHKQDISINDRGIVIKSPENPLDMLVIQAGVLAISNDGGNTYKNAITKDGIIGDKIIGRIIMGTRLIIEDENGIIRFTGSLQEIFDAEGNVRVALGEYEDGKYGIKIDNGALEITGGLKDSHLDPALIADLKDESKIRGDLRLTAPLPNNITLNSSGITAAQSNNANNFARMDYRGLYVQGGAVDIRTGDSSNQGVIFNGNGIKGYDFFGNETFSLNTNGYLTAQTGSFGGSLNAASGTFSGSLSAASGTFSGSLVGATGTFSGMITAGQIQSGGTIEGVVVKSVSSTNGTAQLSNGQVSSINGLESAVLKNGAVVLNNGIYEITLRGAGLNFSTPEYTKNTFISLTNFDTDQIFQFSTSNGGYFDFSRATVRGLNIDTVAKFG